MKDMLGNDLSVGDHIVDRRGRIYQVLPTPLTVERSQVAICRSPKSSDQIMIRLVATQLIDGLAISLLDEKGRVELYEKRLSEVAPERKEAMRQRRKEIDKKLREKGLRNYEE